MLTNPEKYTLININDSKFVVIDVTTDINDNDEVVESIILILDDNTGFVLYYPESENIEYVQDIMNCTRAKFICTKSDLKIFEKQFDITINDPTILYDVTDIVDFVDFYYIEETALITYEND